MAGGRPPKPVEQRRREGNPGHRPLPDTVLVGGRISAEDLKAPERLSTSARLAWEQVVPDLAHAGLLDRVDSFALEALCEQVAIMRDAAEQLREQSLVVEGSLGQPRANPLVTILSNAQSEVRKWCERFGMEPSARARLGLQMMQGKSMADELADQLGERDLRAVS